jgi:hypothetical protein
MIWIIFSSKAAELRESNNEIIFYRSIITHEVRLHLNSQNRPYATLKALFTAFLFVGDTKDGQ